MTVEGLSSTSALVFNFAVQSQWQLSIRGFSQIWLSTTKMKVNTFNHPSILLATCWNLSGDNFFLKKIFQKLMIRSPPKLSKRNFGGIYEKKICTLRNFLSIFGAGIIVDVFFFFSNLISYLGTLSLWTFLGHPQVQKFTKKENTETLEHIFGVRYENQPPPRPGDLWMFRFMIAFAWYFMMDEAPSWERSHDKGPKMRS